MNKLLNTQSISVLIPVFNGGDSFRRCLDALSKTQPNADEVIVIVDGHDPESYHIAVDYDVNIIKTDKRSGPATARNLGAKTARGDIIFFIDADTVISPSAIAKIKQLFAYHSQLTAVIGSYDDQPGASNFLSQYRNLLHHYTHQTSSEEAFTFWGACGAIRRDIFLDLGGFNESYRRPCIEDIELGYRLKAAGYQIRLDKELQLKHLKRWETISMLKTDLLDRAIPWTELILKERRLVNDLNLRLEQRLSVILTFQIIFFLLLSIWEPKCLWIVILAIGGIIWLNRNIYNFFLSQKGWLFLLRAIPWHVAYYLCSGLGFLIGFYRFWWRKIFERVTLKNAD